MENCCLKALIKKFKENDMSAFPVIFDEFEGLMHHFTAKCSAEDTFQELSVFLVELLYKIDISRFNESHSDSLKRYIAVCIGNKYIAISKEDAVIKQNNVFFENISAVTPDFLQKQILRDALGLLTEKQKEIMLSKYIYNYSDTEIAQDLNISRQAVNRIKNRAIQTLRKYLK